jgi:DegV family protein with EDD domain
MIRLVTDSTCDLPQEWRNRLDVAVVPINIQFGTETYLEGVTIDESTFYRRVNELGMIPKTSQPAPGVLADVYRQLGASGDDVLSLHVTGKLSGTVNSAEQARKMVADQVRVEVFDSLAGSAGLGFMVWEASALARAGATMEEILARLGFIRDHIQIVLTLKTLKYAQMSGRVTTIQHVLASLLDLKPIITLEAGSLDVTERIRSRRQAVARMLDLVEDRVGTGPLHLAIIHAHAPQEAHHLMDQAQFRFKCEHSFVAALATSLAANLGPGTLGVVAYPV